VTDAHNPVELAQALIRCKSVTPEEGGALRLLEDVLKKAAFDTHFLTFSEPGTPDVSNLYARIGTGKPVFVFAGHTDVVPPGDETTWSHPPFSGEIENGVLYGRGAVDMKGGVAATVAAALRYLAGGGIQGKGSIVFLITGDEEGPSINGMPKLLAWAKERGDVFDHCLLAEPSSSERVGDELKIGRRGSLSGIVTVHGKQGHVAYPKNADNPIRRMISIMEALHQPLDYGTANFERSNLEITSVDVGNETVNIIPAKATARFNLRFNDAHTLTSVKGLLAERLDRAAAGARIELVFLPGASSSFAGAPISFIDLVTAASLDATGFRPKTSTAGGTSDARYIKDHCPVLELGLVNATMHQVDERVPVQDLETVTRIYERVLERYFGEVAAPAPMPGLDAKVESELEAALAAELNLTDKL
jgi:succinyl-diaminopimelate desuccinylase